MARSRRRAHWLALAGALFLAGAVFVDAPVRAVVVSPDPYWWQDTFHDMAGLDLAATTARVDAAQGTLSLPPAPVGLALRPSGGRDMVVAYRDGMRGFVYDQAAGGMVPELKWGMTEQGLEDAAWVRDRLAVAFPSSVRVYALTLDRSLVEILSARIAAAGVAGVAQARNYDVWLRYADRAEYWAWTAGSYVHVSAWDVAGLADPSGMDYDPARKRLVVSEANRVRVFQLDQGTGRYAEITSWRLTLPGQAWGVALAPDGAGFWVLAGSTARYFAFQPAAPPAEVPARSVPPPPGTEVLGLGRTPWSRDAVAIATGVGVLYYAGTAGAPAADPRYAVTGQDFHRYIGQAAAASIILPVGHTIDKLSLQGTEYAAPPATWTTWEVSTDGGATWTSTSLGPAGSTTYTQVPPGQDIVWRVTLHSQDPRATPTVQGPLDVLEVVTRVTDPPPAGSGQTILTQ